MDSMLRKIMDCYWANFILKKIQCYGTACYFIQSFNMKSLYMNITFYFSLYIVSVVCKFLHATLHAFRC